MPNFVKVITSKNEVFVMLNSTIHFQSGYANVEQQNQVTNAAKITAFNLAVYCPTVICCNVIIENATADYLLSAPLENHII